MLLAAKASQNCFDVREKRDRRGRDRISLEKLILVCSIVLSKCMKHIVWADFRAFLLLPVSSCNCAILSLSFILNPQRKCLQLTKSKLSVSVPKPPAWEHSFVEALPHDIICTDFSLLLSSSRNSVLNVLLLNSTIMWGETVLTLQLHGAAPVTWVGAE